MDSPEQKTSAGMRPWLRVVFGLSLALNLLVVGAVVGSVIKWGGKERGPGARIEQMGGPLTRALSKRDRHEIGREMRRAFDKTPDGQNERRAALEALVADLRVDRFDREVVAGHLARQRAFLNDRMAFGQGLMLERIEKMSVEERAAFADRLEKRLDRGRKEKR
ncbi:periplasmic heavy metal sensor [Roseovarius sp. 2305UL8-3]|uniref:periplasmic heavy metal sensor n=1 Tax=Roseovarius conchicola TaxID=3121636 RepID=UPI0035270C3B